MRKLHGEFCTTLIWLLCFFGADRFVAGEESNSLPKPHVIVEAWHDREFCSDIYAYDFGGNLLKRLTPDSLPGSMLHAVSTRTRRVVFTSNASALYSVDTRSSLLDSIHSENAETVALSRDGKAVAYAAGGSGRNTGRFLYIRPIVSGSPFEPMKIPTAEEIRELAFDPSGNHILATVWRDGTFSILACDLKTKQFEPFLQNETGSYYQPVFAPDGRSIAAVGENLTSGEFRVVTKPWPTGELETIWIAPIGASISDLLLTSDGASLLCKVDGILVRIPIAGGDPVGLTGELADIPLSTVPPFITCRPLPLRSSALPSEVVRWMAFVENGGETRVVDVHSGESRMISLPEGSVFRAVVVE